MKNGAIIFVMFVLIHSHNLIQGYQIEQLENQEPKTYHIVYVIYKYHWEPVYSSSSKSECRAWFKHWVKSVNNVSGAVIAENKHGEFLGGESGINIVENLFGEE